jgi:hypothetical protein
VKRYYFEKDQQVTELNSQVQNLTETLENSPRDSEEGLRAEIRILKKQQD